MESAWPWLAIAGTGALHGLAPATGWALAAACGLRPRDRFEALRALVPLGLGYAASIALVGGAAAAGPAVHRGALQLAAGGLLAAVLVHTMWRRAACSRKRPTGAAALGLGSFLASSAHGAGLMLVPALAPLCIGNATSGIGAAPGLWPALAAIAVHGVSMLAVTTLVATAACFGFTAGAGGARRVRPPSRSSPRSSSRRSRICSSARRCAGRCCSRRCSASPAC